MPIEDLYARIEKTESAYSVCFSSQSAPSTPWELRMCRKATQLGGVEIDQFWLPISSLYGQRCQAATNQNPIVEIWWDWCGRTGAQQEQDIQESYLLAKILPHARGNGSRRVFADSIPNPSARGPDQQAWISELELILRKSRMDELEETAFKDATGNLIGPPKYDSEVIERYQAMCSELFVEARAAINQQGVDAIDLVLANWQRLMTSIGRRRRKELDKKVLDILSYECRAALHRCYSAVWLILLDELSQQYSLSDESRAFHRLWHFDHCRKSPHGDLAYFHLFHGHIFALHPACGPFLKTRTGGELFGQWLQQGTSESYRRLLNAIGIAIAFYGNRYQIQRVLRRESERLQTTGDMAALEEGEAERRGGRVNRRRG